MKYAGNKTYITFHCGRNEMLFRFDSGRSEMVHEKIVNKPRQDIETRMLEATMQSFLEEVLC